jgi:CRISPR/Cas system Type II protein with McrA/HNH and RuvC-like nuclease domain
MLQRLSQGKITENSFGFQQIGKNTPSKINFKNLYLFFYKIFIVILHNKNNEMGASKKDFLMIHKMKFP